MMIPLVTRATEEMIRTVPTSLREAALALGYPRWRTSLVVILRTALPGIITGALVAIARIAGETADQGLDLRGGRELEQFHQRGEAGGGILVGDDAGAEEALLRGGVDAEGAEGVAAQRGGGGEQGFLMRLLVEGAEALERRTKGDAS